ncbi:hypothetical protein RvY_11904-2 [Ramazzottius varieornatus]|nr:hypothetical protein RvY_11904-2 [Ramazzottius varieornatus]
MFPFKPPAEGRYPYYPSCHVRDFGVPNQYFCYVAQNSSMTVDTFMTGLWDSEFQYWVYRVGTGFNGDDTQPFKCCKTPPGYYIDYISCYYMPTHDIFLEYYDSFNHFIVLCSTGYVMTGISRKANPYTREFHIDWIQCCRVGFGRRVSHPPPVTYSNDYSGRAAFAAPAIGGPQTAPVVPAAYHHQYKTLKSRNLDKKNRTTRSTEESEMVHRCDETASFRFAGRGVPMLLKPNHQNAVS